MFVVPPHVLEALRAHRQEQRAERQRASADSQLAPAPERQPPSLSERMTALRESLRAWVRPGAATPDDWQTSAKRLADDVIVGMRALQDEVERTHDAFLLDPGMGPMRYLTADGRVLEDWRACGGDELREVADRGHALAILELGARKTGIESLRDVIPAERIAVERSPGRDRQ